MADAPPPGPPPPEVPRGWKASWNNQYQQFFYVNLITKVSTWEKPTQPAGPDADAAPPGPPPGYSGGAGHSGPVDEKRNPNNPYNQPDTSGDADLARRLQAEEETHQSSSRGAADSYYSGAPQGGMGPGPGASGLPPPGYDQAQGGQESGGQRGLLGKLMGKVGGGNRPPQQPYPQQGGYPPQGGYGGYSPGPGYQQGPYGGPPPQGYPPQGGYYGGPPPQQYVQQQPQKKHGIGAGGAAALGLGGGLIGGALLENAIDDHDDRIYDEGQQQGYDQGYDNGYDQGYDNGDDYGGGDFGGDF